MTNKLKNIASSDLLFFDDFIDSHPVAVDLVYANASHADNLFKQAIYKADTKILGHKDMVQITLKAAEICFKKYSWILEIKDCLRPVEAQQAMQETPIVQTNPHWMEEPRLLSPPGKGGHPRGMAVDIVPLNKNGDEIDMGTAFDYLTEDRENNPAARNYMNFGQEILDNRDKLTNAMLEASKLANMNMLPLPQEWWDFRFMPEYSNLFAPIHDSNLPEDMQFVL